MAYAGVISLKQTIQRLLDSSQFSVDSTTREILEFAFKEATSLQKDLQRLDARDGVGGKRLDSLDGQIREAVNKLEDFLELHQSDLFLDENLILDSEQVRQEVRRFSETAKKLREDYVTESDKQEEEDDAIASSSTAGFGVEMVGYSDELTSMKGHVTSAVRPDDWGVLSIVGRAGTGRSYAARRVFDDVGNCRELSFDCGVWVTIGPIYQCKRILELILTQIIIIQKGGGGGGEGRAIMLQGGEEIAKRCLWSRLVGRRYMVVLDDVCDTQILDYLSSVFPVQNNGSVLLLTTAAMDIALYVNPYCVYRTDDVHINYVDIYWDIFRWVLFRLRPVPPEMEDAGRKIVRNCRGLHICMSKVLLFLWNADRTPQAWNQIANDQHHPVFQVVDELSEMRKIKEDLTNLTVEPASDKAILSPFLEDNGISRDIEFTKKKLFPERFFPKMEVISFVGMAGIGKTTFVSKIFEHLQNSDQFDPCVCVWVTLGPKYQSEDVLTDILAQIFPVIGKMEIKRDAELANDLIRQLSNKRFLIVLDDVWNEAPLLNLAKLFPNIKGRALVTTRLAKVAQSEKIDIVREMRLLNKEESWDLLRQKVFDEGLCPHELEKAGKKIAENCDGLPLTVVKVANLLSKDFSPQYWNDVANKNSDFTNALKELSNALLPSYKSLPHYLKPCFLYMGVFPQDYEVPTSEVLKFWIAEGFLEPDLSQRVEDFAAQCLSELVNRSLVMVCQKGTSYEVKTCRLNSVLWHLSNSEAVKNKFFHALNTYAYDSVEGMKNQRRFCIRNCILFSIKDILDWMMESISTARSLLCTGPYHQYPLPVCFKLRLLRVLDTLAIRFYEFPIEVVKLTHLRHLAITCNGKLPTYISELWNLQFLIVRHHLRIKPFGDSSYLPMEIWDMKELRHLQVTGCNLPSPTGSSVLPNLVTLLDVSSHSFTKEVLKGIPNLKKLGIQIELEPDDDAYPFHYLNHISNLSKLESLKCVVVNPEIGFEVVAPPAPLSMIPSSLEKLSLSGLGYPWEYMDIIGKLENLRVLKLRCYAFQGRKWETGDSAFKKLKHLVIEDTDLVWWKTTIFSFSKLKHLSIKNCYNLEELPNNFVRNEMIEVVDCNPFAVNWAKQMRERNGFRALPMAMETDLKTHVESCWDVGQPHSERKTLYERFISQVDIS